MRADLKEFDWTGEFHKTVVQSLTTSFGLEFLLFDDKKGGDVDTIHNAREWQKEQKLGGSDINISTNLRENFDDKGNNLKKYDSDLYHRDSRYIKKGKGDSVEQDKSNLTDSYTSKKMKPEEKRQLDHTVSANEIHNDAGVVLSGVSSVDLASNPENLNSTRAYINNAKDKYSVEQFVNEVVPKRIYSKKKSISEGQNKLKTMPESTPRERNAKREIEDKIRKEKNHIKDLESIDKEAMLKADKEARKAQDKIINKNYYASSKFLKNTAVASISTGARMGMRQALGLVLAEVWFELREQIPIMYQKQKDNFQFSSFIEHLELSIQGVFERVKARFKDLITTFKDGALGGILSSITTTILNIFLTTKRLVGRLIRETWNNLVQVAKLVFFNPKRLSLGDLSREVTRLLGAGIALFMGVVLNQHLNTVLVFPFGAEISAFISALATGVMTVGLSYFLDHSELMQKVWAFLDQFKSKYRHTLEYFQKVNTELDRYLAELARVELNMNPLELQLFSDSLTATNDEYERSLVLSSEIERREIDLPFESGNVDSTRSWLASL